MLRSFSYAANATLTNYAPRRGEDFDRLAPWANLWQRSTGAEFLRSYREATRGSEFLPSTSLYFRALLNCCRLHKAMYELLYELNNRPTWVRIPLMGILAFPA